MKLRIIAVGHRMPAWIEAGYREYARRMPAEVALELVEIKPEKRAAGTSTARVQKVEAERIVAALPAQARLTVLDEHGVQATTAELATRLSQWMREGVQPCLVIGGADGLDASIKARADWTLGLSRLTLPHGLVRVMLAEQLYRAYSLLKGHPYHRE